MPVNYASALRVVGKNVCRAAAEEVLHAIRWFLTIVWM